MNEKKFHLAHRAALFLTSCTLFREKTKIIEHPPYGLQVDNSAFQQAGCFNSTACLPRGLQSLDPPIDLIMTVPNDFGGLNPAYPIAKAYTQTAFQLDESKFLYSFHCLGSSYIRYLVIQNNTYHLVSSVQDLANFYAPITSPEEAYSYALAATGLSPIFDLEANPKLILKKRVWKRLMLPRSRRDIGCTCFASICAAAVRTWSTAWMCW
jgi:hypothetical protein